MKRQQGRFNSNQLSLFDEPRPVVVSRVNPPRSYADDLKEQIIRDSKTLAMPEEYQQPSRQFYVERIAAYRAELDNLIPF